MKNWNDEKLQEFLDKIVREKASVKPEDIDEKSKENLEQYQKLYEILQEQPKINLSNTFTQSVLKKINKSENRIWSTIWPVLFAIAGLMAGSAVIFFVTKPYLNIGGFGDFFYTKIVSDNFKNVLGDLETHFNFMLLGLGIASFLTIILLDKLLKPQNTFKSS